MRKILISLSTLIATLSLTPSVQAAELLRRFTSVLDANQEVSRSTSTATGFATLDLLRDENDFFQLKYHVTVTPPLNFTDLRDREPPITPVTGRDDILKFHLHAGAERGSNGVLPFDIRTIKTDGTLTSNLDDDLMIYIGSDGTTKLSGLLQEEKDEFTPVEGFPNFESIANALLNTPGGQDTSLYWNIHSLAFPSGAIRGQVQAAPEPGTILGLIMISGLGLAMKRQKNS